jgi:hypothetical protein
LSVGTSGVGFVRRWLVVRVFLVDLLVADGVVVVVLYVSSSFISSFDADSVLVVSCLFGGFFAGLRWRAVITVWLIGGSTGECRILGDNGSCGVCGVGAVVWGSKLVGFGLLILVRGGWGELLRVSFGEVRWIGGS